MFELLKNADNKNNWLKSCIKQCTSVAVGRDTRVFDYRLLQVGRYTF